MFDKGTNEQQELRIASCRSCEADIVWLRTISGNKMPVNADTVEPGDEFFDRHQHISHFSTCLHAAQHRKRQL